MCQRWSMFAVVAVLLACAACTSNPPPTQAESPTAVATTSPSPQQAAEQAALAAYRGMWDAFGKASETADWQSTTLRQYASGYALEQLVKSLQADEVQGIVATGAYKVNPSVVSATPAEAPTAVRLTDCGDDSGATRIRASDRQALPGEPGGLHRIEADVRQQDGAWKVVDFRLRGPGSC